MDDEHVTALESAISCRKELQKAYTAILISVDAFKLRNNSVLYSSEDRMEYHNVNDQTLKNTFEDALLQIIEMQRHLIDRDTSLGSERFKINGDINKHIRYKNIFWKCW